MLNSKLSICLFCPVFDWSWSTKTFIRPLLLLYLCVKLLLFFFIAICLLVLATKVVLSCLFSFLILIFFSLDYCHSDDNIGSLIYTQLNDEHGFCLKWILNMKRILKKRVRFVIIRHRMVTVERSPWFSITEGKLDTFQKHWKDDSENFTEILHFFTIFWILEETRESLQNSVNSQKES